MDKTIQIQLAERSCTAGLRYAQKQLSTPPKDAVLCCEGMCLKGETARRAANLIAHKLVPDKAVRICHGGLLEEAGGMRDLVRCADRVLILDGCGMACATRLVKGAFPGLSPQVVFTDKLFDLDPNLFGVDEMPDEEISANARKVAYEVLNKYFSNQCPSGNPCCGVEGRASCRESGRDAPPTMSDATLRLEAN